MGLIEKPDYDKIFQVLENMSTLGKEKEELETELLLEEAKITLTVMKNREYWFGDNKAPSATLINSTYKVTGLDNELVERRKRLATITSDYTNSSNLYKVLLSKVAAWQTEQANERRAT